MEPVVTRAGGRWGLRLLAPRRAPTAGSRLEITGSDGGGHGSMLPGTLLVAGHRQLRASRLLFTGE